MMPRGPPTDFNGLLRFRAGKAHWRTRNPRAISSVHHPATAAALTFFSQESSIIPVYARFVEKPRPDRHRLDGPADGHTDNGQDRHSRIPF
jgi:hypothetical protein